jgi:hypothetical protein
VTLHGDRTAKRREPDTRSELGRPDRDRTRSRAGQTGRMGGPGPGAQLPARPAPGPLLAGPLAGGMGAVHRVGRMAPHLPPARPELAGALEWHNRYLPGALDRARRELAKCTGRQCSLAPQVPPAHVTRDQARPPGEPPRRAPRRVGPRSVRARPSTRKGTSRSFPEAPRKAS